MTVGARLWPIPGLLLLLGASDVARGRAPLFRERAADVGLRFEHVNGAAGRYHLPEIMGAGGALFDYDGDGDLDVLLVQGRPLEDEGSAASALRPGLFRNDLQAADGAGSLRFADVSARAGFAGGTICSVG